MCITHIEFALPESDNAAFASSVLFFRLASLSIPKNKCNSSSFIQPGGHETK